MFGFDGDYRRRPIQNLGGTSTTCDRETLIKKAQQERQKRNELRRQNNGAIVLQSFGRSFIYRQRRKRFERENFDEYLKAHRDKILQDEHLTFLLRRLIFFFNAKEPKDSGRLIEICQHLVKSPTNLIKKAVCNSLWLHRVKKLLDICVTQLAVPNASQAIPLRMLEIYTTPASVDCYVENEQFVQNYLENIFDYMVKNKYFYRLRNLLEKKCPPLDLDITQPPNQFVDALLHLILRPLLFAKLQNNSITFKSFVKEFLTKPMTEAIRKFLLPCLAEQSDFPFTTMLKVLDNCLSPPSPIIKMDTDPPMDMASPTATVTTPVTTASTSTTPTSSNAVGAICATTSGFNFPFTSSSKTNSPEGTQIIVNPDDNLFSSYLLLGLLILDKKFLPLMTDKDMVGVYLKVIAKVSPLILYLPKSTLKIVPHDDNDEIILDDSDEDDDDRASTTKKNGSILNAVNISEDEQQVLLESIERLNESKRVNIIVDNLQESCDKSEDVLYAMCELCHNLMIYNKGAIFEYKLLYTLAFKPKFMRSVWFLLATKSSQLGFQAPIALISKGLVPKQDLNRTISLLATFCMLFGRLLPSLHDMEFCEDSLLTTLQPLQTPHIRLMPFSIGEIVQLSKTLKEISMGLVELAFPETRSHLNDHYRGILGKKDYDDARMRQEKHIWSNLLKVVVFVLNQIYTRDLRLNFCPEFHWIISRLDLPLDRPTDLPLTRESRTRFIRPFQPIRDFTREDFENGPPISTKQIRSITILREIPFIVAFSKRVGILQGLIAADKIRIQGNLQAFLQGPSISITVRRTHLYEDAYSKLRPESEPDLRLKFRILFVSSLGLDEAGIDGGGVFREFLSELLKTAFDPNRGFFMVTTDNKLYPNPNIATLVSDFEKHYYFIGRILGKAMYENLLVELPLAEVFLTKLAGKYSDVDIHQLASLDPELYRNLLYLKDYEGDVSELGLDFTVASSSFGQTEIIELKPNGQSIPVTKSNRIEYLQLMANYKLNVQIRKQCIAFRKGLSNVLPVEWLYMFSNKEMQILISGAEIPIDIEDLKRNCKYGGEYSPEHPSIVAFWEALESFTDIQRRQFLKFVTSCSRPPLLGFKDLDPPFFIQNAGDMARLPTASTCTNLLKLPPFKTVEQMREKLLYAIQSGAGFELS